ncbi:MAG: endonuclease/exonuclease/phosphatase family metal-dependent hydrolase, partial [Candidatus Marinamargulisbacteria bacterium]
AVQEIDLASKRSCFINQVDYISRTCNFPFFAFAYTWDLKWVPYPFTLNPINHFGKVLAGQAVFSKFPILDQTITTFPKPRANNPLYNSFFLDRVLQTVTLQLETDFGVNIHNVHLEAFHKEARLNQIRSIVDLLQKPKIALPSIILGDFNAIAQGSIEIDRFPDSPNIDYGKDPTLETLLNLNEWDEVGSEKPDLKTFPSDSPNRRLDYIFYSNAAFSLDETFVDPNVNGASDHLPILADFSTFKN